MPSPQEDAYEEDEAHGPPRARAQPSPSSSRLLARSSLFKRRRRLLHFATFDFNSRLKVGVRSGRTWPRALSRPLSGRSQSGGHSAAAQSGRTTICRSFSFPTGAREGGLVPGRARRQARCPASAPPSATLWPWNAAHEALTWPSLRSLPAGTVVHCGTTKLPRTSAGSSVPRAPNALAWSRTGKWLHVQINASREFSVCARMCVDKV